MLTLMGCFRFVTSNRFCSGMLTWKPGSFLLLHNPWTNPNGEVQPSFQLVLLAISCFSSHWSSCRVACPWCCKSLGIWTLMSCHGFEVTCRNHIMLQYFLPGHFKAVTSSIYIPTSCRNSLKTTSAYFICTGTFLVGLDYYLFECIFTVHLNDSILWEQLEDAFPSQWKKYLILPSHSMQGGNIINTPLKVYPGM